MKIGILTHYDVNNQGAQLQLYALYAQLAGMGHSPVVLTYKKNYDFAPEMELRNQITLSSVPYILKNYLMGKGLPLTVHNVRKYRCHRAFRREHFRFASYCRGELDAVVVGADEVFSLEFGANMMMFGHGVATDRLIAYAPSAGQTGLERIARFHCTELVRGGLSRFSSLSARDGNTHEIIRALTGKDVPIVCDPVLLYRFTLDGIPLPKGTPRQPYLAVYSYDARFVAPDEVRAIRDYARRHKLKTVSVGTYHGWCDVNVVCDCLQWLRCIQGAEAVVTDTFHGTIAAAITGRPLALSYSPATNASKMVDLIGRLGFQSRLLAGFSCVEIERVLSIPLDVDALARRIEAFRESSMKYLTEALYR